MKFRIIGSSSFIHGTYPDETNDFVDIVGDTIEEIRRKAEEEVSRRGWANTWSDQLHTKTDTKQAELSSDE